MDSGKLVSRAYAAAAWSLAGSDLLEGPFHRDAAQHISQYLSPKGYSAFCFQTYIKMHGEASVTLNDDKQHSASLDASALFEEVHEREAELKTRVAEIYDGIYSMRDQDRIQYQATQSAFTEPDRPVSPNFRLVWHFAGTCRVGDVVDPEDFSVMGVKGLHVADMSACRVTSDGGSMAMAYLTGHVAAAHMLRSAALRELELVELPQLQALQRYPTVPAC